MKKITLSLFTALACVGAAIAQPNVTIQAPLYDGSNSSLSTPSGSTDAVYHRACWLILQSELTDFALTNSVVTHFGVDYTQGVNVATTGQVTVSLENTNDLTYSKGTAWPACLSGMTTHYTGAYSLPVTNGFTSVSVPLTTNFTYTGGGVYVAFEWYAPAAASTQWARAQCNTTYTNGGVRGIAPAAGPAPTTLSVTAFRPSFNFRAANTATNEASIVGFQPLGQVSKLDALSQTVTANVRNNSGVTMSNVVVGLSVSGANTFVDSKTITSIPSGTTVSVSFNPFTATNSGANNMTVALLPDQDNTNNNGTWTQSVSCSEIAVTPAASPTAFTSNAWIMSSGGGIIAFKYTTGVNASTLTSINCVVPSFTNAGNAGNSVFPVLCDATGAIVAQGNPVVLAASNMDVHFPFTFSTPVALTPNTTYYFGLGCATSTNGPIGFSPSNNVILGHYRIPLAGGTPVQSSLDYVGISASIVTNAITLTSATTKTNVCKNDKWLLTASGASTYTWNTNVNTTTITTNFVNVGVLPYSVVGTSSTTGCKTNKASITFSISACTGLENNESYGAEIKAFPNPAINGKITVTGLEGTNTITVYNVLGQIVSNTTTSDSAALINLENEAAGNYMVKISNSSNQFKMIKVVSRN